MIALEVRNRGYIVTLAKEVSGDESRVLAFELDNELAGGQGEPFVLQLDAREFHHFTADGQAHIEEILERVREKGLARISLVAVSTALAGLFRDIMMRTELMDLYQYVDLSYETEWEAEMEAHLMEPFNQD